MLKKCTIGTSLGAQRSSLHTASTGGMGSSLCPGTRITQAARPKTNKNKRCTVIWPSGISVNETGKFQQTNNSNFIVTWFGYFLRRYIVNTGRTHRERSNTDKIRRKKWILLYRWKDKRKLISLWNKRGEHGRKDSLHYGIVSSLG